jgi:cohesin complex subunit SA-1/2
VFVHRYRDLDPVVRTLSMESLLSCIVTYPSFFLKDTYLKYVGWNLSDKVRATAVAAIAGFALDVPVGRRCPCGARVWRV